MTTKLRIYFTIMMLISFVIAIGYVATGGHALALIIYPTFIAILLWIGFKIGSK